MKIKKKRLLSLLMTFLIMTGCLTAAPATAADIVQEILVPNAGFEEVDADGWAKEWSHFNVDASVAEFEIDSTKAYSGKNSLHIKATKNNPWAATTIEGVVPGCFYELSMFINSNVTSSTWQATGNKLEFYSGRPSVETALSDSAIPTTYPLGAFLTNTNDRWVEHKTIFHVPENTKVVKIYCRIYGQGEAWFDDLSVKFSGGPAKYAFDTEKVFHYKEETDGTAYVNIDPFYEGQGVEEDTLVDFTVFKGEEVCEKAENVKAVNMSARYTYSTSYMEPYERYTLKCKIKNGKGDVLEEHEQNLYVVDRPSMLSEDGYLMVDGKRYNPISAYHVDVEDYAKAAEGGINTVQFSWAAGRYEEQEYRKLVINTAKQYDIKGILSLYVANQNAGHPSNIENTKKVVEEIKDDDTIIALAMQDEPFINGDDKTKRLHAEEAYLEMRKIDKKHPIYICDKRNEYISVKYCDILCIDAYAMGGDTRSITSETKRAWEASKDKNGFWELAATYNSNGKFPTMNDARNSVYRAFAEGASGIGYFAFSDAGQGVAEKQQLYKWDLWEDFCKFNKEEAPILFDRFVNGKAIVFNEYDDNAGAHSSWESMKWFDWFVGDDMYLAAHNRGRNGETVTIPLKSRNGKIKIGGFKAEPIGLTTQKAVTGNGEMTLTLGSEEIALFKIIPDEKVDLSRLNESSFDDLAGYDWAEDAISALDAKNVLNTVADGKYGPGEAITRIDFVSFLVRALGLTEEGEAFPDCDVKEIKIARRAGITNGDTDGNFRPNDTITRQDIMTTAVRALSAVPTDKEVPSFSDWNLISEYAVDAVTCMVQAEVIVGNGDGTLNPLGLATRAEAAVMLHRILNTEFEKAAAIVPDAPKEVKEEIAFDKEADEATLQNWKNAADLLNALGVSLPLVEKSVTYGEFEKAIEGFIGTTYDVFSENLKAITYAEAVEELVKLLGYEAYVPSRGGYMAMASQLDLTKGISPEEYIRAGELAVLLENASDIKLAERTDYGKNEEYRESEDTLLSLYRNIYKVKGTVEETYYTGANVRQGEILLDGIVYTGGAEYHRQRVVAYAEFTDDEKKILYIKPASGTETVKLDTENILEADTSVIRYESENGKDELVSITGATVYVNGEKKGTPSAADLRPEMGTVTLVYTSGAVTSILVEKYENRIVQSVYKEDNTVYFKNGKELILETEKVRYYVDFEAESLKEWNVISVYTRGDGSLYKVALSTECAQGEPSEISADGILLGDKTYPVAKTCLGAPVLGISAKYYLDINGKIAAVDDKNVTPEYGYLTKIAPDKGIDGGVSLKIFTKNAEMKVFEAADSVSFNGTPKNGSALLSEAILRDGEKTKEQLVIYEVSGEGKITALETAQDAVEKNFAEIPEGFSKVFYTGDVASATSLFSGYNMKSFACLYRIGNETVNFIVPAEGSDNAKDYSVVKGSARYAHSAHYVGCELFDWHEDYTVGAAVQRVSSTVKSVPVDALMGMVSGVGDVMDAEGNIRKAVRLIGYSGTEVTYYADEDFRVVLDADTLTDMKKETEVTVKGYITSLNPDMPVTSLNKGDIVQFSVGGMDGVTFTGMRAVIRAKSPLVGENAPKNLGPDYNYSERTVAYGPVVRTVPDGVVILPGAYERLFLHYWQSGGIAPVLIYDSKTDKIEVKTIEAIRKDDMVFCRRLNPYLELYAVYR